MIAIIFAISTLYHLWNSIVMKLLYRILQRLFGRNSTAILLAICLFFAGTCNIRSQELGANFNESIDGPLLNVPLLKASGVTWIRGFVDLPLNFLTKDADGRISGVKTSAINGYVKTQKFVEAKKALNGQVKAVMSLKIPFENYTDLVPDPGSPQMNYLLDAIQKFLLSYDLGKNIDILVMGNEPEFENGGDAAAYEVFLNLFADTLAQWKTKYDWQFMVFAGSLNRVSELKKSTTIPAVVRVVNTNKNVDGIDLHVHAMDVAQLSEDIRYIREIHKVTKRVITTEFSLNRLLSAHVNDDIGSWGTTYGYPTTVKMYTYLNYASQKAAGKTPLSDQEFLSYFESRPWYPAKWYRIIYEAFKKYKADAMIGRFESAVGVKNYDATSAMWDLGAIYSGTFMGNDNITGLQRGSVLVYPEFKAIIDSLNMVNAIRAWPNENTDCIVYPNPAGNIVYINTKDKQPANIKLIGTDGRILLTKCGVKTLDLSTINQGHYILQIETETGIRAFKRLIVNK